MNEKWKAAVESYIKEDDTTNLNEVVLALSSDSLKLLDVVESLGTHLTNSDATIRARGTKFLAELLHQLPPEKLNGKETEVMSTFFVDRMKDHHSVTPHVLYGMLAMSKTTGVSAESISKMLRCIFAEIHLQTLAQGDRRYFYEMCVFLLTHRLQALQERGAEFVCGFVQGMDGERDPRNLILGFECVQAIAKHLPMDMFTEELFEVISCYFPIEFTPSAKDPNAVTKEDLILSLRKSLVASPKFAEYCLPLLLEKLTSSVQSAKVDALLTLAEAASTTFGPNNLKEFTSSLWSAIRREVFSSASDSVVEAGLTALSAMTACLSTQAIPAHGSSLLDDFISDVFTDVKPYLCDPDQQFMVPSGRLLECAAKGSELACVKVLALAVPALLETYGQHTQANQRRPVLETLLTFVNLGKPASPSGTPLLGQHKDKLYAMYLTIMAHEPNYFLRSLAVKGITGMMSAKDLLSLKEISVVAEHLVNLALTDQIDSVAQECNVALTYLASQYPDFVRDTVLPGLKAKVDAGESGSKLLRTVACLSSHGSLARLTLPLLLNHLRNQNTKETVLVICENIHSVIKTAVGLEGMPEFFVCDYVPECTRLLVTASLQSDQGLLNDTDVLVSLSNSQRTIIQSLDTSSGQALADLTLKIFRDGDLSGISGDSGDTAGVFRPLHAGSPSSQSKLLPYFTSIICSLDRKVTLDGLPAILDQLYALSMELESAEHRLAAAKCLAGIINKMERSAELDSILERYKTNLMTTASDAGLSGEQKNRAVLLWSWLVKALVLKSHALQKPLTETLVEWFAMADIAKTAADGFFTILNEFEDVMSIAMHADVKIMYRQRFFTYALPLVVASYKSLEPERRSHCLTALSYLLRFVPKQVLAAELPPLVPLLLQSLLCEVPSLWLSTLETLYDLLHDAPLALAPHVDSLLPLLLRFSQYRPDMRVRQSALQCLGMLSTLPAHLLLPHRTTVTRALAECLDDHKRLVRREAVKARGQWFLIGEPGS